MINSVNKNQVEVSDCQKTAVVVSKIVVVALAILAIAALTAVGGWQAAALYLGGHIAWSILVGTAAAAWALLSLEGIREIVSGIFGWQDQRNWVNDMYKYTDDNFNDTIYYLGQRALGVILFPLGLITTFGSCALAIHWARQNPKVQTVLEKAGIVKAKEKVTKEDKELKKEL